MLLYNLGRAIEQIDGLFVDKTNRSIEFFNLKRLIKKLQEKDFAVMLMAEFGIDFKDAGFQTKLLCPKKLN